jgi:hypothetical protein
MLGFQAGCESLLRRRSERRNDEGWGGGQVTVEAVLYILHADLLVASANLDGQLSGRVV